MAEKSTMRADGTAASPGGRRVVPGDPRASMTDTQVLHMLKQTDVRVVLVGPESGAIQAIHKHLAQRYPIDSVSTLDAFNKRQGSRADVVFVDAALLRRHPERILKAWHQDDPAMLVIVTGAREHREHLLEELSSGLIHRFILAPATAGPTRLALESAVRRHSELRQEREDTQELQPLSLEEPRRAYPKKLVGVGVGALLAVAAIAWGLISFLSGSDQPSQVARNIETAPVVENSADQSDAAGQTAGDTPTEATGPIPPAEPEAANVEDLLLQAGLALAGGRFAGDSDSAIALYSEVLAVDPDNAVASSGIDRALQGALAELELEIDTDQRAEAQSSLTVLLAQFPSDQRVVALAQRLESLSAPPEVAAVDQEAETGGSGTSELSLESDLPSVEEASIPGPDPAVLASERAAAVRGAEIQRLAALIQERTAAGAYLEPAEDSARYYLSQLRELDSTAPRIPEFETQLLSSAVASVGSAFESDDINAAARRITVARELGVSEEELNPLVETLSARRAAAVTAGRQALLDEALGAITVGSLIDPSGESATDLLAELESEQPDFPGLNEAKQDLAAALLQEGRVAAADGDWPRADRFLRAAQDAGTDEAVITADLEDMAFRRRQEELFAQVEPASILTLLDYTPPDYPRGAVRRNIEGSVLFAFTIGEEGVPIDVVVENAEPLGVFEEAATIAVNSARFEPYRENDRVFRRRVTMRIRFALE